MIKKILFAAAIIFSCASCAKEEKPILPYVKVNVIISFNDPEYIQITNPTTAIKVKHYNGLPVGFLGNGIIVFNSGLDYYAFDASCTNNDHSSLMLSDQIYAVCDKCKTKYSLITGFAEGNPSLRLQRYSTMISGNNLSIYN